jgi:hypothetical protein
MMIFRPTIPVTITTTALQAVVDASVDPAAVTTTAIGLTQPSISIGVTNMFQVGGTIATIGAANWTGFQGAAKTDNQQEMHYKIQPVATQSNPTIDLPDQGNYNTIFAITLIGTPVVAFR